MKLATTTGDFKFVDNYEEVIKRIYDAGFRYLDLSIYSADEKDYFIHPDWKERVMRVNDYAQSLGMRFIQAHSPDFVGIQCREGYEAAVEKTIRSIEICGAMNIPSTVVHSIYAEGMYKDEFFEKNKIFHERLYSAMEENNVNVLIENSTEANMRNRYFFFTGADMKEFIEYLNHPLLHACWDTGHANIEGHQYEDIMVLGKDLYALHINDNRGVMDEHIIPYLGNASFDEVMNGLLDIGYNGYFTFEAGSSVIKDENNWIFPRRKYDKDNRLMNPPAFIYDDLEKLKYKIGEYILEKYNCKE